MTSSVPSIILKKSREAGPWRPGGFGASTGNVTMVQARKKVGKSESALLKDFCGRSSEDDLRALADLLPPAAAFDRVLACEILQRDNQVDRWLQQANGADDWFMRVDSVGDAAAAELEQRMSKK